MSRRRVSNMVDRSPDGLQIPAALQFLGRGAWLLVGIAVAIGILLLIGGMISNLLIPLVFAAILASIFVPVVDRLERAHVPRVIGAPIVVIVALIIVVLIAWIVVVGMLEAGSEIAD